MLNGANEDYRHKTTVSQSEHTNAIKMGRLESKSLCAEAESAKFCSTNKAQMSFFLPSPFWAFKWASKGLEQIDSEAQK